MRSKASIKGHPLHPILVSFPIVLFTCTFLLDLIAFLRFDKTLMQPAEYAEAAGLIAAVFAATAGIIDYHYTVPPHSSAKHRATKHAIINGCMFMLFATVYFLRITTDFALLFIVSLEAAGIILIGIAAWLGGTLVTRNQIGIDHRYAETGKWREDNYESSSGTVRLKDTDSIGLNQMRLIKVNGKRIVLARTENGLVAFDDHCTHRGGSLADGVLVCGTVQCPWHGSQFDVHSGMVKAGPAAAYISIYGLRTEGKSVILQL
jgi:uncharacterized membrane protein/nitrite reductase/ring-hydroxylating ferredoxin subunit